MIDALLIVVMIVVSYLLGSIPFGLILTKYAGLGDIRNIGSGNIGATNVLRTGNKKLALATLLCDAAKGMIAVGVAHAIGGYWIVVFSAIAAVVGHVFPVWLQYKGGKGVATALAVYWVAYWPLGLFACLAWAAMFYLSRISSLSALAAMALSPVIALFFGGFGMFLMSLVIGGIVIYRHKENIDRLMRGQEPTV
ncbi:MAG: plsY [Rickettsiaceae bacterium]|jgi:glycerol-3-phosphate acyltransferase PlsY|nr:plsY [Rickettsiaceae bacterium]